MWIGLRLAETIASALRARVPADSGQSAVAPVELAPRPERATRFDRCLAAGLVVGGLKIAIDVPPHGTVNVPLGVGNRAHADFDQAGLG